MLRPSILAVVALSGLLAASLPGRSAAASANPALLWSDLPVFSSGADQQTIRISHEVKDQSFLFNLVDALAGQPASSNEFMSAKNPQKPDAIVLIIGQAGQAGNVLEAKNAAETALLRQAMSAASSSLALPFLQAEDDLVSSWEAHAQKSGVRSSMVGQCSRSAGATITAALSPAAATQGIQAALGKSSQVVLVCSGEEATLQDEMLLLEAAKTAGGSSSAVYGFIVQPPQASMKTVGRSLLEATSGSGSLLRLPTEDDLASIAASRGASAGSVGDILRDAQKAALASDPSLTPAGFNPRSSGLRPSPVPRASGNQGGSPDMPDPFGGLVCDDKCQVQVTMIEVAILGFTLISALVSGTWLMHGVGTPTRFEQSKEGHGQ
ncbi:hypothetical protein WJX84_010851 [Apatococcus fuscideae]|uniref:VWFA domain-containing protein n=1 Tax=Apatococcus fuscideae TaxID=2026836 RepID=A0AAW1TAR9_9CHLO